MLLTIPVTLRQDLPSHCHDVHEMVIAVNDHGFIRSTKGDAKLQSGCSYLVSGGIEHGIVIDGDLASETILICFDKPIIDAYLNPAAKLSFQTLIDTGFSRALADSEKRSHNLSLAKRLIQVIEDKDKFHSEIAGGLLNLLLLNHLSSVQLPVPVKTSKYKKIQQVITWLETSLSENLSVDGAAEQAQMSRAVFTKQFRQVTGKSFAEYVAIARLRQVENMLSQPEVNITDIAFQSGFRNLGHFYKSFQKHYGMTPNQYRKILIQQGL